MRKEIMVLALALGLAQAAVAETAAKVNGDEITVQRLDNGVNAVLRQQGVASPEQADPTQVKEVRQRVMDVLISQRLLWQEAKGKDITVTDAEVEQAMAEVKGRFQTEQEFLDRIGESGFTEETYREDLKQQLSVRRFISEDLSKQVTVSDAEIDEFYKSNLDRMQSPEQMQARHILIKVEADADEAADLAAREKIDKLLEEAKGGTDFAELASKNSEGPSASRGGDLGFFGRGQMVPAFEQAAFALQPGELSGVVRTQFGYHIIKAEARRGGETASKEEAADQIREYLQQQKLQQHLQDHVKALREQAEVEVLVAM